MSTKRKIATNIHENIPSKASKKSDYESEQKDGIWTFDDRCRLVEAMNDEKFRKFPFLIRKYIGTKSVGKVKTYMNYFKLLESGRIYQEFKDQPAALDVWLELMEKTTRRDDKKAEQCIPQIMTVAALEPSNEIDADNQPCPNYSNVYNYLAMILKGEEPVDLPPLDAQVVLHLLDGLTDEFRDSHVLLQKEFLHEAYGVLASAGDSTGVSCRILDNSEKNPSADSVETTNNNATTRKFPSLNPLNVPAALLEFRKKKPIVLDFSTNWRTTLS